jgi:hypothetical protein
MIAVLRAHPGGLSNSAIPRSRTSMLRLLAGAAAMLILYSVNACGPSDGGTPSATSAVSIPTGHLTAYERCMLDAGWRIAAVHSVAPGEPQTYTWIAGSSGQEAVSNSSKCQALLPSPRMLTSAEMRETYDRWVGERECLVGLGYQPDGPPSVESFVASWSTGPWMPIDGIDTDHWTDTQFNEAKEKCTLEFFDRDVT